MAVDTQNNHHDPQHLITSSEHPPLCSTPHRHCTFPSPPSSQILNIIQQQLPYTPSSIAADDQFQYEVSRLNIMEKSKLDLATITNQIETKFINTLIQKDQQISISRNRTTQLELILHRAETQQQQWRSIALFKETQSIHLNNTLHQLLSHHHGRNETDNDRVFNDDAESYCDVEITKNRVIGVCRACGVRDACVVLLPCRHLCCCVGCELRIDSCLVCRCSKQNAVQVLLS